MTQKRWSIAFAPAGEGEYQVTVRRSGAVHRFTAKLPPDISELWSKAEEAGATNRSFRKAPEGIPDEAMFFQAANLPTLKEIGERVLNTVFDVEQSSEGPKIIGALEDRIADNEGVQIEIDLSQTAELSGIPWESLYLRSRDRFLAIGTTSNIVRRLDTQSEVPKPIERPIRILVAAANPHKDLDTSAELANIRKRIDNLVTEGSDDFVIEELPAATRDDFRRMVNDWRPHIVHYIGHSSFRDDTGYLYFESPNGQESDAVSAEMLRNMLLNRRPWMVVLNSCRSGETSGDDPMGGVAQNLLQRLNIPFVVAMQQPVSDDAAIRFSQDFYAALTSGESIADAVTMGRCAISNDHDERTQVELITPALYTSGDTDRIAFVEQAPAAAAPTSGEEAPKKPISAQTRMIGAGIAALAVIGGVAYFAMQPNGGDVVPEIPDGPVVLPSNGPDGSDERGNDGDRGSSGGDTSSGGQNLSGSTGGGATTSTSGGTSQGNSSDANQVSSGGSSGSTALGSNSGSSGGTLIGAGSGSSGDGTAGYVAQPREVPPTPQATETPDPQGYPQGTGGGAVHVAEVDPGAAPDPQGYPPPPPPPPPRICDNPALIFFEWDSAVPPEAEAQQVVDFVAANFYYCEWYNLTVVGHADRSGPNGYNLRLSEARANAVAEMLQKSVPEISVHVEYRGEQEPRVPTQDGVREIQNRRVEIQTR